MGDDKILIQQKPCLDNLGNFWLFSYEVMLKFHSVFISQN